MATGYDLSDLTQLIDMRSGALTAKAERKKDYDESINKGLGKVLENVGNITSVEGNTANQQVIDYIAAYATTTEGMMIANQANIQNKERGSEIGYYEAQVENITSILKDFEPQTYTVEDNVTGESYEKFDSKIKWKSLTIEDFMRYNLQIDNILSAMYEDPFAEKPKISDLVQGVDLPNINKIRVLKSQFEAAEIALKDNGVINEHELRYIKLGDAAGLQLAREQHAKSGNARLTSIQKSINSVKKYKKELYKVIAEKGGGDFSVTNLWDEDGKSEITSNSGLLLYMSNPGDYLSIDEAIEDAQTKFYDSTPRGLLKMWEEEERLYQHLFQIEHDNWYRWQASEWAAGMSVGYAERERERLVLEKLNQLHNP
jgi:hypothetical protein